MLTSDKSELLQTFLGALPERAAARLAKAVEVDRLADGTALPHQMILDSLRPTLRKSETASRTPTPLRLFCLPFEDLLCGTERKEKQKGRIARSSVLPVWNWLAQVLLPDETKAYCDDIKAAVLTCKLDAAEARAKSFRAAASLALREAIARDAKGARHMLGSDFAVADAKEISLLLLAADQLLEVQRMLPKPVPVLSEELLWSLRQVYETVSESAPDAAPFVPVVAMRRLAKPWEALKLALLITHQTQDTLISSTDLGLVGDTLFTDMEDCRVAIHAVRQPAFDVEALLRHLTVFTDISSAICKEIEILRRGKWGQRLLNDRAAVGGVMDAMMERAPKEIAAALPSQKGGFTGGPRGPDFSRPVAEDKIDRALRYAKLIVGSRKLAAAASFGAKQAGATDEATQLLRSYNEDVVKELRSAEGERRDIVERQFQLATELTALLFSEEEAEFLRRRGRAASSQAAA
jgi:hypothetical protein